MIVQQLVVILVFSQEGVSFFFYIAKSQTLFSQTILMLKTVLGASLVSQWLRIHLPMQGTRVRALVQEDPTCRGATKPVSHNY